MNYSRVLVGDDSFPKNRVSALIFATATANYGCVFFTVTRHVPTQLEAVYLVVAAVVAVGAVGACAYKAQGILFGWLLGAAAFVQPLASIAYPMAQKSGEAAIQALIVSGVIGGFVFSFVFCCVGLVLGGGVRWFSTRHGEP